MIFLIFWNVPTFAYVQEMMVDPSKQVRLGFISGLVPREKAMAFERILFRATRGNVFLKQAVLEYPVVDPASSQKVNMIAVKILVLLFYMSYQTRSGK